MKGSHNEKALQRIEELMGLDRAQDTTLYFLQEELGESHPAPRAIRFVMGGTEAAREQHRANFLKAEADRLKRLKKNGGPR
jgi:hypothetical protein